MLELRKIKYKSIRNKWQRRFAENHDGRIKAWCVTLSGPDDHFYVASDDKNELGFIRINDKSKFFAGYTDLEVWCLAEAFVKPEFRHKGVLREMIAEAVRSLNVRMVRIPTDVFDMHRNYYASLGFTYAYPVHVDMTWAFLASFEEVIRIHDAQTRPPRRTRGVAERNAYRPQQQANMVTS